jgi:hypothetical protein
MNNQQIKQARTSNNVTDSDHSQTEPDSLQIYKPRPWLGVLVTSGLALAGVGGFAWLYWSSLAFSEVTDGLKFLTEGSIALALLIVAAAQACVYWSQRGIMRAQGQTMVDGLRRTDRMIGNMTKSVDIAEKSFIATMRPQVDISGELKQFAPDKEITVELQFINEGNGIAENVYVAYQIAASPIPPVKNLEMPFRTSPLSVLPHKARGALLISLVIPKELFKQIKGGTSWLRCWGIGSYSGLGGEYPLEFSLVYRREIDGFSNFGDLMAVQRSKDEAAKKGKPDQRIPPGFISPL